MKIETTPLKDLLLVKPDVYKDSRGYFYETYNYTDFDRLGIKDKFVQDNESMSRKGVPRGLHYQKTPFAQAKLVRVIKGAVLDVAVDIRKRSSTYGQYFAIELNEENKIMLLIPEGFAHGFLTLADHTILGYKCSNVYNKESEGTILWNDLTLRINWGIENPVLSKKDKEGKPFK